MKCKYKNYILLCFIMVVSFSICGCKKTKSSTDTDTKITTYVVQEDNDNDDNNSGEMSINYSQNNDYKDTFVTDIDGYLYEDGELVTVVYGDTTLPVQHYEVDLDEIPSYRIISTYYADLYANLKTVTDEEEKYEMFKGGLLWNFEYCYFEKFHTGYIRDDYIQLRNKLLSFTEDDLYELFKFTLTTYTDETYEGELDANKRDFCERFLSDFEKSYSENELKLILIPAYCKENEEAKSFFGEDIGLAFSEKVLGVATEMEKTEESVTEEETLPESLFSEEENATPE